MKIYRASRKGFINYLLIGFMVLPVIIFLFDTKTFMEKPYILLPLLSPLSLILWIYIDTYYKIENDKLIYHSGFLRGVIEIYKIKEVIRGRTLWSGVKPALAQKGLIIKYDKYEEIYVAPVNNDEFISDLLKVHPKIQLTG